MPADTFIELSSMDGGNTDQNVIIVNESKLHMPRKKLRALTAYQAAKKTGSYRTIGNLQEKVFEERPFRNDVKVTAQYTAGGVTLAVDDCTMVRKGGQFLDPVSGQAIDCNDNPASATAVPIVAATYDIAPGTIIKYLGVNEGEDWDRQKALSRNTGNSTAYISTLMDAFAFTWHNRFRKKYIKQDPIRIEEQSYLRFEQNINHQLMFSTGGVRNSKTYTQGLWMQGLNFNWVPCPGVLTREILFRGCHQLFAEAGASKVDIVSGFELNMALRTSSLGTGMLRYQPGQNPMDAKIEKSIVSPDEMNLKFSTDHSLNAGDFGHSVMAINWDMVGALDFGEPFFQRNSQNPGTGRIHHQMLRCVGFEYFIPAGAVVLFTNVRGWRP